MNTHVDNLKERILSVGVELWETNPERVTARNIANILGCVHGTIRYHFGTTELLKYAIAEYAVTKGNTKVIAYLIVAGHDAVKQLPVAVRETHMRTAAAR